MLTPKAARKLKRRIENDAYAKDARAWRNQRTVWAAHTVLHPVNKNALNAVTPQQINGTPHKRNPRSVCVYLFRVKTKGHNEVFLKIGVSNSVPERFAPDKVRYKFSLLDSVGRLTRKEAVEVEGRLHALFSHLAYKPRFGFVTGGHTECFFDDTEIIETVRTLFGLIREERKPS